MKKSARKSAPIRRQRLWMTEIEELRTRLAEAEETLEALRDGNVDAVVMKDQGEHQVFSLSGADRPYRVYVEQMQEGAVTVSADGMILFCNLRFATMLETPLQEVSGTDITRYISAEDWSEISGVFKDTAVVKREAVLKGISGSSLPVLLTASELPLMDQKVMCLVVTDLRFQEENARLRVAKEVAESANHAKDRFLAVLSHELRTPLTPVLMSVTALESDPATPPELREELRVMKRNIELETRLIDDLLDLNRMASGKLKLQVSAVEINEAIQRVCVICEADAAEGGVKLRMDLHPRGPYVAADAARLQQVLWNLIKNAIKFTPTGGEIRVLSSVLPDGRCEIQVRDSGIGIALEALPRIFDAFEQGHDKITQQFGGLGLGLAITKALVQLHGGEIRAESKGQDQGSSFILWLPTTTSASGREATAPQEELPAREGLRLLVVEDHGDTLATLERLLTRRGYVVHTASSISESLEVARTHPIDLLISDIGLPDGRGTELLQSLEKDSGRRIPSIAMSGFGMDDDVERSRHAGFSEHLTKPVEFASLHRAILRLATVGAPHKS